MFFPLSPLFRPLLFCPCLLAAIGSVAVAAGALPAAPEGGILDDTRALSAEGRQALLPGIADLRARRGISLWLVAETFLPQGQTPRDRARNLRQAWSLGGAAALLLYDRSTGREHVSFSPDLWARLASAGLFHLHQRVHERMQDQARPLEQKLAESMRLLEAGLAELDARQSVHDQVRTRDFFRLGRAYGLALACGSLAAWLAGLAGLWWRRAHRQAQALGRPPGTQVPQRLGAPHGSTVCGGR